NLPAQETRQGLRWRWLWIVVPVVAALVIAVFLRSAVPVRPEPIIVQERMPPGTSEPAYRTPAPRIPVMSKFQRRRPASSKLSTNPHLSHEPRLETFPTTDRGEQARLLMRFVIQSPREAQAVAQDQLQFQLLAEDRMNKNSKNETSER